MIDGTGALHVATHQLGGEPAATEYCLCLRNANHPLTDVWLPGDDPNEGGARSGPHQLHLSATHLSPRLWSDRDPL